ncbi:restriction endonuclease subunit S [Cyanobium sp. WAJ14-Wanaka]|uniref:restriction endonuclease subunit S n=1 Tax=Cyanobium sp. WAJ14-Wanaka TaxID=2823725 RepID=UPI0020CE1852|nr:restriction endonuclease subunit S [Cyanobium sp. WAJ14-Wanaka]MCP9774969.1 restriction endonuclease subunit S [Cyanobium sp. WAJ14-Wanaka]
MIGWETKQLGDVCSFLNRGVSPKYVENGGIVVINQRCIRDHRVNFEVARRHDIMAKAVSAERFVQAGDVLVNSTGEGTLGRVAQLRYAPPEPTTVDSHVTIVRPEPGIFFTEFFGYVLRDIEEELKKSGEGCGGQTELNRSLLAEKSLVRFPKSLAEQQRIVGVLDEAFAGLATAQANAARNLQNARALFESHLQSVFTQRGEGWMEKALGECFRLKSGDGLISKEMKYGAYPVFGGNGIAGQHNDFNLSGDNVIIGRVGALCGNARHITEKIWLTDNAFKLVDVNADFDNGFLTYLLNYKNLRGLARQAAQPVISNSSLKNLKLEFPSRAEQQRIAAKFDALATETQRLASLYEQKQAALADLKKSLLHQAFSGEL